MTVEEIAKMMDVSAVQAQSTREDIDACCALAAEFGCAAVFCLPAHVPYLRARMDTLGLKVPMASVSGFPGGAETPRIKAETARELVGLGCDEVDMVDGWRVLADGREILRGRSIGMKRIRLLPEPVAARKCEVEVTAGGGKVELRRYIADAELVNTILEADADSGETDTAKWMTGAAANH